MNPQPQTIYTLVPVSEKPPKDGWYFITMSDGECEFYFKEGKWLDLHDSEEKYHDSDSTKYVTHWLRKEETKYLLSEKELKKIAGEAWDAGREWERYMQFIDSDKDDFGRPNPPDKETYLESLNPNKVN